MGKLAFYAPLEVCNVYLHSPWPYRMKFIPKKKWQIHEIIHFILPIKDISLVSGYFLA